MHIPVLLNEVIRFLAPRPGDFVIDGTVDGGGHALALIEKIGRQGAFLGTEWDEGLFAAFKNKAAKIKNAPRIVLKNANYAEIPRILEAEKLPKADILFLDLGFSSEQLETGKGLSFQKNEPLDMRYSRTSSRTAKDAVNFLAEEDLARIFREYGEERYARRIAARIAELRRGKKFETTHELADAIASAAPRSYEGGRIHPATRIFQALRIWTNDELTNLASVLARLTDIVCPGGRVGIISFHSLEDRLVKNRFRDMKKAGLSRTLTKKPITAEFGEVRENPRARSAKFRVMVLE